MMSFNCYHLADVGLTGIIYSNKSFIIPGNGFRINRLLNTPQDMTAIGGLMIDGSGNEFTARQRHVLYRKRSVTALFLLSTLLAATAARAEGTIGIAQQYGIGYLILDVVRDHQLIEKHGKDEGLDIKVEVAHAFRATGLNEGLLSGALDVVAAGVPPALTLWDRTRGKQNVKAIAALGSMPNYLLSNNPAVQSVKDLSSKDRIAVPAAGVGFSRGLCR